MFLNIQIDLIILKTHDQLFTLTTKKSLHIIFNGPFVYGGTNCTRGWNLADIFFTDSVKIMRFYDFARTSVS